MLLTSDVMTVSVLVVEVSDEVDVVDGEYSSSLPTSSWAGVPASAASPSFEGVKGCPGFVGSSAGRGPACCKSLGVADARPSCVGAVVDEFLVGVSFWSPTLHAL